MREDQWQQARKYLFQALKKTEQKGILYLDLAKVQWKLRKVQPAMETVQKSITAPELNNNERALATYNLAGFLAEIRRFEDAQGVLKDALRFDPDLQKTKNLLNKIEQVLRPAD